MSTVRAITDPDEAETLFKAGLVMWNDCWGVRPLAKGGWDVQTLRKALHAGTLCVIEED
jgi:hypothetical protein